jgi:myo-inositol-1(or 4)-monophosphatase
LQATDAADLDLLTASIREAGQIARDGFEGSPKSWEKSKGNPVTETDLAVDRFLNDRLCGARPDYGWLSEESSDNSDRLTRKRLFVVDPIDGTIAFIKRKPEFVVCGAVVESGVPVVAAILNPITDEMFTARRGAGAMLNGQPIVVSRREQLEGCRMLVARDVIEHPAWTTPWPKMDLGKRGSIAYRMALVANGTYDGMMALSAKHEWDSAAGTLIVQEAGGLATSHNGAALPYNQKIPTHRSLVCAGPAVHKAIMARTDRIVLP